MTRFRHEVTEANGSDYATISDQGTTVGVCIDSGEKTADLLLTPEQARELAEALVIAAWMVERAGKS